MANPRAAGQYAAQVSTSTVLNAIHTIYSSSQPYPLDASSSAVVNTWLHAARTDAAGNPGGIVDGDLAKRAWEHARRRAEDGCVVLASLHRATPSLLAPFISSLPFETPPILYTALAVLRPFIHSVTPYNPSTPRHSTLAVKFSISLSGTLTAASLALSKSGIDTNNGLLNVPSEPGHRAFDVFYYLLASVSTQAEKEFLNLKHPSEYALLNRSGTYNPPQYLPTADDAASADDFRSGLRQIGIKGAELRQVLSVLAALLKLGDTLGFLVDEDVLEDVCEDVSGLLGIDAEVLMTRCSTDDRAVLISGLYESLVDWVISRANKAIADKIREMDDAESSSDSETDGVGRGTPRTDDENGDTVCITVLDVPDERLGKAIALRSVFDDSAGINAEMREDGIEVDAPGSSVVREMRGALADAEADLGLNDGPARRERSQERDRRETVLERVGHEADADSFLKTALFAAGDQGLNVTQRDRVDVAHTISVSRAWYQLALHPTDELPSDLARLSAPNSAWSAGTVSRQLRAWRLPEWVNRRSRALDFTADFDFDEFHSRYAPLGCKEGKDGVESWVLERGWSNGEVVIGHERVWIHEGPWWEAETMLDLKQAEAMMSRPSIPALGGMLGGMVGAGGLESGYSTTGPGLNGSGFFGTNLTPEGSRDNLLQQPPAGAARSIAPTLARTVNTVTGGDYGLGKKGDDPRNDDRYYNPVVGEYTGELDPELAESKVVTSQPISTGRRIWVAAVWACTFFIPSFALRFIGRMKRPDVRMAWREKLVLMYIILFFNGVVLFWIIEFGRLLCPTYDKVWNAKEVSTHTGDNDFYVSIHGKVYDISKFWKLQHSDTAIETTKDNMDPFKGMNMDDYFPPPLTVACPNLVTDTSIVLQPNNTILYPNAKHSSGPYQQPNPKTALHDMTWYKYKFIPRITDYYKGELVVEKKKVYNDGQNNNHMWFILNGNIYDLTNYFYTKKMMDNLASYSFLDPQVETMVSNNPGTDISDQWANSLNDTASRENLRCLNNAFYAGKPDFRNSARCQVNGWILVGFAAIMCSVIVVKFLAALQLGSKKRPAPQDKFVICQVPAYTEGEDELRKGLDSLTALQYDNKRKLICVICDGMIVGGGNDRPTPKIVLDILGVDPKIDPPALPFKSVGQGSDQLNYGKVYSGLYECEGNVVPYMVVVKVGKESEQNKSKPGNRGKRDSQILLMSFLNRVHHRSPMSPLELEMFHQINNIIGVDPELYEYLLMVDADTSLKEDSLNRLVAACANDNKIAGICGETSLQNEEQSWTTMIQVYEYFISHHLAKSFESLFGSVTCLPGCFCMYRIRTADKGRPLIISDKVIEDYSDNNVDTLHKKNLLSLGEDRYLTTLMTKYFPQMSFKFVPGAHAATAAPDAWGVLLSQRRRWINSTIHNLAELVFLKDLCGFCCFSMRFVVFLDLFGTIILPSTCGYLIFLFYRLGTHTGAFPVITIIMIAGVYGLQAIIFIIKRQWQHVGWMLIYMLAFPIYSVVLPLYSFWKQDDFSWGSTRIVIGEKGNKQIVAVEEEKFDPRSIPLQRWDDYATANNLPGRRNVMAPVYEKGPYGSYDDNAYEMDDMQSMYSSVKPASTILTGFPNHNPAYMAPPSPAPFAAHRQSSYSNFSRLGGDNQLGQNQRLMSMGNMSDAYQDNPYGHGQLSPRIRSTDQLAGFQSTPPPGPSRSPLGFQSRPTSTFGFQNARNGPDDFAIADAVRACLAEVDLDTVTKKQVRALVEQRLQTELSADRRAFLDRQIDTELANM
ncbi:glycosyltransferase family 2 protein [Xylona heveae TC161]|uniref:Chitin synthase A n=1 Tax=Xylona heveae (strain CBS 132557 / TC161) TaxID=1328760 RepID=A0A165HH13_XYLHT|nr:glycosyltransferase family 2 protein [Xylona heveae TC161]KZF23502.1 glycosyltransferase family 2 protein [Xylona heveae TC161]